MPPLPRSAPFTLGLDADIDRHGDVVLATQAENAIDLHFVANRSTTCFPRPVRYPGVRWIGSSQVLLFDRRSAENEENAWSIDQSGKIEFAIAIGDAVEDVAVTDKYLVVTYFDEGALGKITPSTDGIAVFSRGGTYLWGWNASLSAGIPRVYDCYAVADSGGDTLGVHIYTSLNGAPYAFALLDLETRSVAVYDVPERLYRTQALTYLPDGTWLFAVPSGDEQRVMAWRPGRTLDDDVRSPARLTRGLAGGRFVSVTDRSADIFVASSAAGGENDAAARSQLPQIFFFDR